MMGASDDESGSDEMDGSDEDVPVGGKRKGVWLMCIS
jgi:hypothetical protein